MLVEVGVREHLASCRASLPGPSAPFLRIRPAQFPARLERQRNIEPVVRPFSSRVISFRRASIFFSTAGEARFDLTGSPWNPADSVGVWQRVPGKMRKVSRQRTRDRRRERGGTGFKLLVSVHMVSQLSGFDGTHCLLGSTPLLLVKTGAAGESQIVILAGLRIAAAPHPGAASGIARHSLPDHCNDKSIY